MADKEESLSSGRTQRVLMVTGAYYPEVSGAGLACRSLIGAAASDDMQFGVVTTAVDRSLPSRSVEDGVEVLRLPAGGMLTVLTRWLPRLRELIRAVSAADIVHLHGFSRKSYFLGWLARRYRKKIIIKMSSLGEDDPQSVQRSGGLRWRFYRTADLYLAPSPALADSYRASSLPDSRLRELPNGVDISRFRPADAEEKAELRRKLAVPEDGLAVVSLGHFSAEKRLGFLAGVWSRLVCTDGRIHLWLVGENRPGAYEVDGETVKQADMAGKREQRPGELAAPGRVNNPDDWLRAADIFVLPSVREGMPNALLEAMSCGLAVVAARLPGITDTVLSYGGEEAAGLLFIPDNDRVLGAAIASLAGSEQLRDLLGRQARDKIERKYSLELVARRYREIIIELARKS